MTVDIATLFRQGQDLPVADAASLYARAGLPVFACGPGAKRPLTPNGHRDATTTTGLVTRWWRQWPQANIGLATGGEGFDVVDVDRRQTGSGFDALKRARRAGLAGGWVAQIRTPSGGVHLYYPAVIDRPQRSWANTTAHVDFRGTGGYVIVPPSRVTQPDGTAGTYRLVAEGQTARPIDAPALKALLQPTRAAVGTPLTKVSSGRGGAIAAWLATRPEGTRNNALFWAACRYAESAIDQTDAHRQLGSAGQRAGLKPAEIAATIRSAYRIATPHLARHQVSPRHHTERSL